MVLLTCASLVEIINSCFVSITPEAVYVASAPKFNVFNFARRDVWRQDLQAGLSQCYTGLKITKILRVSMANFPTQFDRDDLLKCARGELFGEGNAQLPGPPMLMMDRITDISEDGGA